VKGSEVKGRGGEGRERKEGEGRGGEGKGGEGKGGGWPRENLGRFWKLARQIHPPATPELGGGGAAGNRDDRDARDGSWSEVLVRDGG
jgi:hypothetical protein